MRNLFVLAMAGLACVVATPLYAQKSQDMMRYAISSSFSSLSQYFEPIPESVIFTRRIYESLISYDERGRKFVPILAKSWVRVNPTTLEFDLRDDITFHNGNKFDADDVVATFNFYADEKTPLRNKNRYDWVEKAEKLGPYKVRVISKTPNAIDMGLIAYRYSMEDLETRKLHSDPEDYGRKTPVGTGTYKVTRMDPTRGVQVERFDDYRGDQNYSRAPIKRVAGMFIPDIQTQMAQLLTNGVDVIANVNPDQANDLKDKPGIDVTTVKSGYFWYLVLASHGKVNKAIADPRVREAIHMAIDRDSIIKYVVPGGALAEKLDAPCFKSTIACKQSKEFPKFDRERAKGLLAEAGYPNGFDLNYVTYGALRDLVVAVSGDLLKIGIRATVSSDPLQVYRKKQADGVLEAWSISFSLGNFPDVTNALEAWFVGPRAEYFNFDPIILDALDKGLMETDPTKREEIYKVILDRNVDMHYVLPISSLPVVYAHSKDVKLISNELSETEFFVSDYQWK